MWLPGGEGEVHRAPGAIHSQAMHKGRSLRGELFSCSAVLAKQASRVDREDSPYSIM